MGDSTLLLASGMGRHWPDGRGVFHNDEKNLFVWVGEEDHLRIVSMQGDRAKPTPEGKQIKEVTARFMRACAEVQKVLKAEGSDFMHNDHLGWVLTCPSNLGTGLRAGTMVRLPKLSAREDFKQIIGHMGLQARGPGGVDSSSRDGLWDISNAARVGKGEVDLVNILIEGAAQLVRWESALDAGEDALVHAHIQAVMAPTGGRSSKLRLKRLQQSMKELHATQLAEQGEKERFNAAAAAAAGDEAAATLAANTPSAADGGATSAS